MGAAMRSGFRTRELRRLALWFRCRTGLRFLRTGRGCGRRLGRRYRLIASCLLIGWRRGWQTLPSRVARLLLRLSRLRNGHRKYKGRGPGVRPRQQQTHSEYGDQRHIHLLDVCRSLSARNLLAAPSPRMENAAENQKSRFVQRRKPTLLQNAQESRTVKLGATSRPLPPLPSVRISAAGRRRRNVVPCPSPVSKSIEP